MKALSLKQPWAELVLLEKKQESGRPILGESFIFMLRKMLMKDLLRNLV